MSTVQGVGHDGALRSVLNATPTREANHQEHGQQSTNEKRSVMREF
jgi:hypothetical protein